MGLTTTSGLTAIPGLSSGGGLSAGKGLAGLSATQRWATSVVVNGGSVSPARQALVQTMINGWISTGAWFAIGDAWLLTAENATQALTSLVRGTLATAVNAPTFTTDRGYAFNGTTQYINTNFNVSSSPSVISTSQGGPVVGIKVYERTNVNANTVAVGAGVIVLRPRNAVNTASTQMISGATTLTGINSDSRGLLAVSRTAFLTVNWWKNGVAQTGVSIAANSGNPANYSLFIGALSTNNVASQFRASTIGFVSIGGAMSSAQETAFYNTLQTFMTAIGANV